MNISVDDDFANGIRRNLVCFNAAKSVKPCTHVDLLKDVSVGGFRLALNGAIKDTTIKKDRSRISLEDRTFRRRLKRLAPRKQGERIGRDIALASRQKNAPLP